MTLYSIKGLRILTLSFLLLCTMLSSCKPSKQEADAIFYNAKICTVDEALPEASVLVVKDGKILDIGAEELLETYDCADSSKVDLKGKYIYPGLIDAHCHFYGYAKTLLNCDLVGSKSWEEVIDRVLNFSKMHPDGWINGRGWDQNDWENTAFPDNSSLNTLFPLRPVVLKRIDGHAVICNSKALELAGITEKTKVQGGEIVLKDGKPSGVLIDNAVDLIQNVIPAIERKELIKVLKKAEAECFSLGLTTLADAGLPLNDCLLLDSLGKTGDLNIYLYMMLNPDAEGMNYAIKNGIRETDHSYIGSFKLYADGALGSRGAKLKHDYSDRHGHSGFLINNPSYYDSFCRRVYNETKYQVNTHCIGDSANRLMLETYGRFLKKDDDRRWRIEHAQVIDPADFYLFGKYGIIPSVQPTHAGSDGPWAEQRLSKDRIAGAYAYKTLLQQNAYLPLGTDFPVEYISPFNTFFSAVFRGNAGKPEQQAFLPEQALTHMEALQGMSIWAAKACKLEHRKGSLSKGKDADFIVLDKDLLKISRADLLKLQVESTWQYGKQVYRSAAE